MTLGRADNARPPERSLHAPRMRDRNAVALARGTLLRARGRDAGRAGSRTQPALHLAAGRKYPKNIHDMRHLDIPGATATPGRRPTVCDFPHAAHTSRAVRSPPPRPHAVRARSFDPGDRVSGARTSHGVGFGARDMKCAGAVACRPSSVQALWHAGVANARQLLSGARNLRDVARRDASRTRRYLRRERVNCATAAQIHRSVSAGKSGSPQQDALAP